MKRPKRIACCLYNRMKDISTGARGKVIKPLWTLPNPV